MSFRMGRKCGSIFVPASGMEARARMLSFPGVVKEEWVGEFMARDDVRRNPDGSYDVDGDVDMRNMMLSEIPLMFGKVGGDFGCSLNPLASLKGSPREVGGDFWCERGGLVSLEGGPERVGGDFGCGHNHITSLVGAPREVGGNFNCLDNRLTSLEGAPRKVGGSLNCWGNELSSLGGIPERIGGDFRGWGFSEDDVREVCEVGGRIYV